jgi:hypothetical protein
MRSMVEGARRAPAPGGQWTPAEAPHLTPTLSAPGAEREGSDEFYDLRSKPAVSVWLMSR